MNKRLFLLYLVCVTSLFSLIWPTESHAENGHIYEVGTTHLNIRSSPSHDAPVVGQLQSGDQVTIFSENSGWGQTYYNGEVAWIASQYLTHVENTQNISTRETQIEITASNAHIRSGPGTNYSIIDSATSRDTYPLIESSDDWVKVYLSDDTSGWIARECITQTTSEQSATANNSLAGYHITLDPGHGGKDPGSIGLNDVTEKDLINTTTKTIVEHLRDAGATVILTREEDSYVSLDERIQTSHANQTDAFISIHYNSFPVSIVRGTSTFYYEGAQDQELAESIQTSLSELQSVYDRGAQRGDYQVLRENKNLAVLIELGFITNPEELDNVQTPDFQIKAAKAITDGLINYFNP